MIENIRQSMRLFDVFNKEAECQKCRMVFPKKELNLFDPTFRGKKGGEKIRLCRKCLSDKFYDHLRGFKSRAIIVYPLKKYNAYQYYTFDEMVNEYNFQRNFVEELKLFLPPNTASCSVCGNHANVNWVAPDIYFNDPFSSRVNPKFQQEYLCSKCLARKFAEKIKEKNLSFDEFFPVGDADGISTSFEV